MGKSQSVQKKFGATVRRLRTEKGLSQEAFAASVGIHRTYIGGIERGERNPTLTMIERIARALDVDPGSLVRFGGGRT
jgi:transcriptional regulator with XRE-family HTH domain